MHGLSRNRLMNDGMRRAIVQELEVKQRRRRRDNDKRCIRLPGKPGQPLGQIIDQIAVDHIEGRWDQHRDRPDVLHAGTGSLKLAQQLLPRFIACRKNRDIEIPEIPIKWMIGARLPLSRTCHGTRRAGLERKIITRARRV